MTIYHFPADSAVDGDVIHLADDDETLDLRGGYYVVTERTGDLVMLSRCGEDEAGQLVAQDEGQPVPVSLLGRMFGTGLRAREAAKGSYRSDGAAVGV